MRLKKKISIFILICTALIITGCGEALRTSQSETDVSLKLDFSSLSSSGFRITSGPLAGDYQTVSDLCVAASLITPQCIQINGTYACTGFGPCMPVNATNIPVTTTLAPMPTTTQAPTPTSLPPVTTTVPPTAPTLPPIVATTTTLAPPIGSGFLVETGILAGHYSSVSQFCATAASKTSQCIYLNGQYTCEGFGPCMSVISSNYSGPTSTTLAPVPTTVAATTTTLAPVPTTTLAPTPTSVPPITTTTTTPPITGVVDLCYQYPSAVRLDQPYGNGQSITTRSYFPFTNNVVYVGKFTVPLNAPTMIFDGSATVAEYDGPPTFRFITISKSPCDFRTVDPSGNNGPFSQGNGVTAAASFSVGGGNNPKLIPGETYYVNIRNYLTGFGPTCMWTGSNGPESDPYCNAIVTLSSPR